MNEHTQDNDNQSRIIGLNFQNDFSFSEIRIFEILKISILRSLSVLVFKHVLTKSEISFFRRKKNDSNIKCYYIKTFLTAVHIFCRDTNKNLEQTTALF